MPQLRLHGSNHGLDLWVGYSSSPPSAHHAGHLSGDACGLFPLFRAPDTGFEQL